MKMVIDISEDYEIEWWMSCNVSLIKIHLTEFEKIKMDDCTEAPVDFVGRLVDKVFERHLDRFKRNT